MIEKKMHEFQHCFVRIDYAAKPGTIIKIGARYHTVKEEIIGPKVQKFSPDLILVSAGFDAHWIDPLASERLSLDGYSKLIGNILDMANEHCGGKMVVVLEGGYHPTALSHGVLNTIYQLLDVEELSDPL